MLRLLADSLRTALRSMAKKPFRTFLVLQGMIWGTAVAVMPPAIIDGSRKAMLREAERVGTDRVVITSDAVEDRGALTFGDLAFLEGRFGGSIEAAAAFRVRPAAFRAGGATAAGWLVGTSAAAPRALGRPLREGAAFGEGAPEAVLDAPLAGELGLAPGGGPLEVFLLPEGVRKPDPGAVSARLREGEPGPDLRGLRAAGILAPLPPEQAGVDDFGFKKRHFLTGLANEALRNMGVLDETEDWRSSGRAAFVPAGILPGGADRADMIVLRAKPEGMVRFLGELQGALSERGRAPLVRWNVLAPVVLEGRADKYFRLRYATFFLCLVMGAIVISNVMLFTVLENTREIAIRRVEGATTADIVLQHLFHAVILSTAGGLLGVPAGLLVARLRIELMPGAALGVAMPWGSAALAVGCTVLAGILAGVLPARRAAGLDPVEALRNE
ncbi:MAG: ABC transporter permease [Planctomycetes bacterium]|nr:ABC transporter permease [Planctomycetota bacterium]